LIGEKSGNVGAPKKLKIFELILAFVLIVIQIFILERIDYLSGTNSTVNIAKECCQFSNLALTIA
jgi:hypothetical protein